MPRHREPTPIPSSSSEPSWLRKARERWPSLLNPPPPSTDLQPLAEIWQSFLLGLSTPQAIAITIQPNLGPCEGASGSTILRGLIPPLFYRLDQLYSGCSQPSCLAYDQRFNGFVILEKRNTSPHVHMLIYCTSGTEFFFRSLFLLEHLDNVQGPGGSLQEDLWRASRRAWIGENPWSQSRPRSAGESVGSEFFRKGTFKVQPLTSQADVAAWLSYITKEWKYSYSQLADRRVVSADDWALDYFELRDAFSEAPTRPARRWKRIPGVGQVLDLDDQRWRIPGKGPVK